jgi:hypothetical protein
MAGQPITLDIPAVGSAGPTYATKINTALTTLETELERKVVPADMNINTDLSFLSGATYSALTDVKRVGLSLQSEATITAAAFPMSLFVGSTDGELYFNDNSGRQVQITTDGTVNVSTTGGITGAGYGASDVEVRWDSGDAEYEFRTGAGTNDYADLRCDDLVLNDGSANFVRITAAAMASDYTITLPSAAPVSTALLQMGTTGIVTTTDNPTLAGALIGALGVTGDTVLGGTTTATGLITANGGVTCGNNDHVTVAGTGQYKHGDRTLIIPGLAFQPPTETADISRSATAGGEITLNTSSSLSFYKELAFPVGVRVTNIEWHAEHVLNSGVNRSYVVHQRIIGGANDTIETDTDSTLGARTITSSTNFTITANTMYYLKWTTAGTDSLYAVVITYDLP